MTERRSTEIAPSAVPLPPGPGPRSAALGFIFAATLMDVLALGIIIPILPNLILCVGDRATPLVQRVAAEIYEKYGGSRDDEE